MLSESVKQTQSDASRMELSHENVRPCVIAMVDEDSAKYHAQVGAHLRFYGAFCRRDY